MSYAKLITVLDLLINLSVRVFFSIEGHVALGRILGPGYDNLVLGMIS